MVARKKPTLATIGSKEVHKKNFGKLSQHVNGSIWINVGLS